MSQIIYNIGGGQQAMLILGPRRKVATVGDLSDLSEILHLKRGERREAWNIKAIRRAGSIISSKTKRNAQKGLERTGVIFNK
jgi:hypothetical protein